MTAATWRVGDPILEADAAGVTSEEGGDIAEEGRWIQAYFAKEGRWRCQQRRHVNGDCAEPTMDVDRVVGGIVAAAGSGDLVDRAWAQSNRVGTADEIQLMHLCTGPYVGVRDRSRKQSAGKL